MTDLKTVETQLEKAIEILWKASLTVADQQSSSSELLPKRMQEFVDVLSQLESSARALDPSVAIPLKVVEEVDLGQNPDLYLYELGKAAVAHSDELRGAAFYATNLRHMLEAALPPPATPLPSPPAAAAAQSQEKKDKSESGLG